MEIKVREVTKDTKSKQEVEKELLDKHEEKFEDTKAEPTVDKVEAQETTETPVVEEVKEETPSSELNDEDVLSYIKNRYDKDIASVDDLFAQTKDNDELPEDVSAYLNFKKETGRGIEDFYKLQKDYDVMDDELLLADYYGQTEEGLDAIDIQDLIDDKFSYDEDLDDERSVKKNEVS